MFEKLRDFFKKVRDLFSKNDIKTVFGTDAAISEVMSEKINEWLNAYRGVAPWIDDYVKSLKIEESICREFADVVLSERTVSVSNKKLDNIVQKSISMLTENLQSGIALGSFVLKPLGEDKAEFVTADKFVVLSIDDNGRVDDIAFISKKVVAHNDIYYRFDRHTLDENGLTIRNYAYHSKNEGSIGTQCALSEVYSWANLPEEITYPADRVDFGYYRNPIKNEIDGSFNGISVFDGAMELIRKADIQFGRLEWEFESGERAINVDITALTAVPTRDEKGKTVYRTPKLNNRLYRGLNLDTGNGELYKEFSPEFREESIINGLEQMLRKIEFIVGLAYGDLSKTDIVEKTAEEIKHSKNRKYNRVKAIERNLQTCLEDFIYGLSFYNRLSKSGYTVNCNFADSILTSEEAERKQDAQDVAMGAMNLYEYRMKWYNEDEATAKARIAESATEGTTEVLE